MKNIMTRILNFFLNFKRLLKYPFQRSSWSSNVRVVEWYKIFIASIWVLYLALEIEQFKRFALPIYKFISNYNFLKERISSIEKALINFTMDINKSNAGIKEKINSFSENTTEKIEIAEKKNNNFMENILIINEQNNNFFKENIENIRDKMEKLESRMENIENKLDEIIKKQDTKKGLFR